MRLDQALVHLGLAPSRTKAQELIQTGSVEVYEKENWITAVSSSAEASKWKLPEEPGRVRLKKTELLKYVSRGGLKLESALEKIKLEVADFSCVDVGQSTGGFTDCLLQRGAKRVVGFDVGHHQLSEKIKKDPRVLSLEGLHLKDAATESRIPRDADLIVADLSFISIEKFLPEAHHFGLRLLALVKPQFEVGAEQLNKNGIVKDPALYEQVEKKVRSVASRLGWKVLAYFPSQVEGRDGNQEFFIYASRL